MGFQHMGVHVNVLSVWPDSVLIEELTVNGLFAGAWPVLIDDFVEFARPIVMAENHKTL